MIVKNFNCRGSRWNEIKKSELGDNKILICRPVSANYLKKYGQMATAIDILITELPKKYQNIIF